MVKNIERTLYYRKEVRGMTTFDCTTNFFSYYPSLDIEQFEREINTDGNCKYSEALRILSKFPKQNTIDKGDPLHINWLIEDKCNLDCVYCFADDKFNIPKPRLPKEFVAEKILSLNPLSVCLTGGEPTLNKDLPNILRLFAGKCSITIDTNGTTPAIIDMIPLLLENNVLVRITVDCLNEDLLNELRPFKGKSSVKQSALISNTIEKLHKAGVRILVHTVLTHKNIAATDDVAKLLIKLNIPRWHLHTVNYSEKCKDIFDELRVSKEEVLENKDHLQKAFGNDLLISHSMSQSFYANSVLMVDSVGAVYG